MTSLPPHQQLQSNVVVPQVNTSPMQKYKSILFILGIIEIVLGGICCLFGALLLFVSFFGLLEGIWCGIFLIPSGILGVIARFRPTRCMYNANITMSIVATMFMLVLVVLSVGFAIAASNIVSAAFHSIIAFCAFTGFFITIVHFCLCCASVCCGENQPTEIIIMVPPLDMAAGPMQPIPPQPSHHPTANAVSDSGFAYPGLIVPPEQERAIKQQDSSTLGTGQSVGTTFVQALVLPNEPTPAYQYNRPIQDK